MTGVQTCALPICKGKAVRKGLPAVLALTAAGGAGELVLSQINTTLSNFIPAVIALVLVMLLGRMKLYNTDWKLEESPIMERVEPAAAADSYIPKDMSLIQAFMPYLLLSVMTFVVLAVKPINEMLGRFKIGIVVPETRTGYGIVNAASDSYSPVAIFTQAGMFLFLAAIIALAYYKSKGWIKTGGIRNAFANSISMTMPSGMAVIGLVIMSKIMGGTGQTIVLSQGIANALFDSPVRSDGSEKWVDYVHSFWHVDCVRKIGLKTFTERYRNFCKHHASRVGLKSFLTLPGRSLLSFLRISFINS